MSTPDNVVRIPRPARSSYNPERPLDRNPLLKAHVEHLSHAEMDLPPEKRTGIDIQTITTEGQAAAYIQKVTAILHPHGVRSKKVKKAT